jgi:uncharacterized protein YecE (DUF72 family)
MHYIGTSGYSYTDWTGPFYPEGCRKGDFLKFYSDTFNFTELNFSYYRMPDASMLKRMVDQVPRGFLFTVKAHASLTHQRGPGWEEQCELFCKALEPLSSANALGGVLLQFPYSFHYTIENRRYLDNLLSALEAFPAFVEFRNAGWQKERVLEGLDKRGTGIVICDEPELKELVRFQPRRCGPDGYFRFHGRNAAAWWTGDNASRYDYRYGSDELALFSEAIREVSKGARRMFAAFNNHRRGQAVDNARELKQMLARGDALT